MNMIRIALATLALAGFSVSCAEKAPEPAPAPPADSAPAADAPATPPAAENK